MSDNNNPAGGGLTFVGLLTIAFVVLRLMDIIDWAWVWVLSPLWISAAVVAVIALAFGLSLLGINRRAKSVWRDSGE